MLRFNGTAAAEECGTGRAGTSRTKAGLSGLKISTKVPLHSRSILIG